MEIINESTMSNTFFYYYNIEFLIQNIKELINNPQQFNIQKKVILFRMFFLNELNTILKTNEELLLEKLFYSEYLLFEFQKDFFFDLIGEYDSQTFCLVPFRQKAKLPYVCFEYIFKYYTNCEFIR